MTTLTQPDQSTHHNPKSSPHYVILLAAGQSRRLGQPKQLLEIQGQPLLHHMTQLALATTQANISVVVPKTYPEIGQSVDGLAIDLVPNPTPETGMALSLSLAIDAMKAKLTNPSAAFSPDPAVFIMGVDQVRLTSAHLQQLLTQYQACENTLVTASQYAGVIGLPLVIRWSQLLAWQPQLTGDKGLRKLIRALPDSSYSTIDFPELAYDIDTPEQYEEARQQGWLD
jgi:molybdenum cofactor cytidylyltransferase